MKRLAVLLLAIATIAISCTTPAKPTPAAKASEAITAIAEPIARAEVRREIIAEQIKDTRKPVAIEQVKQQKNDLAEAKTMTHEANAKAQEAIATATTRASKAEDQLTDLEAKWYVWAGRWIERILIGIIITYVGLGISAIALCIWGGPIGLVIGREILGILPVANIFTNISRWIGGRNG